MPPASGGADVIDRALGPAAVGIATVLATDATHEAGDMTKPLLPAGCIVVGVDGSEHADRAVTWAARQAVLERRTLALVHCTDQISVRGTAWVDAPGIDHPGLTAALRAASSRIVTHARDRAVVQAPDVAVLTDLLDVDPREALVDLSATAHLLVLGSRGRGPLRSAVLGSVSASVARHAHCPVVVCRPPEPERPAGDRVVVGADGTCASRPVLEFAFAQASLLRVPLTVMHCFWDVVTATRGPGTVPRGADDELTDLRLLLAESIAGLAEKYPDVEVTQELARGLVDECLADRAPDAGLVVVGRASTAGWARFLHASCALAVLERAHATVAVVPESPEERKDR
jgi:nucleotide-binding universal stress UspA family protein